MMARRFAITDNQIVSHFFHRGYTMHRIHSKPSLTCLALLTSMTLAISAHAADPMAESQRQLANKPRSQSQVAAGKAATLTAATTSVAQSDKAYLHCVFRVGKDGKMNLLHATEVAGEPLLPEATGGGFLYEVARGNEVLGIQGMADPFERRAFPGPKESKLEGHHFDSTEEADIIVKIPNTRLSDAALSEISLAFYEYQGSSHIDKLDKEVLAELKAKHQLKRFSEMPARTLGQAIQERFVPTAK